MINDSLGHITLSKIIRKSRLRNDNLVVTLTMSTWKFWNLKRMHQSVKTVKYQHLPLERYWVSLSLHSHFIYIGLSAMAYFFLSNVIYLDLFTINHGWNFRLINNPNQTAPLLFFNRSPPFVNKSRFCCWELISRRVHMYEQKCISFNLSLPFVFE